MFEMKGEKKKKKSNLHFIKVQERFQGHQLLDPFHFPNAVVTLRHNLGKKQNKKEKKPFQRWYQ